MATSNVTATGISFDFHYKPADRKRPFDESENTQILTWEGENVPVPAVGDTVSYQSWEQTSRTPLEGRDVIVFRKVLTRHFMIHEDRVTVYFVVGDVSPEEQAARLKE